jgi:hypothetical protein
VCLPKHVEQLRNIWIINSTTRLHLVGSFYEFYITTHRSMNINITRSLCEPVVQRRVLTQLVRWIQFTPCHPYCLKPVSLSSHLFLCLPSGLSLSPSRFPTKFLYEFCFPLLRTKRSINIRHLDSVAEMLQVMKLSKLSVMHFFSSSSYFFLLGPKISSFVSYSLLLWRFCFSRNVRV